MPLRLHLIPSSPFVSTIIKEIIKHFCFLCVWKRISVAKLILVFDFRNFKSKISDECIDEIIKILCEFKMLFCHQNRIEHHFNSLDECSFKRLVFHFNEIFNFKNSLFLNLLFFSLLNSLLAF